MCDCEESKPVYCWAIDLNNHVQNCDCSPAIQRHSATLLALSYESKFRMSLLECPQLSVSIVTFICLRMGKTILFAYWNRQPNKISSPYLERQTKIHSNTQFSRLADKMQRKQLLNLSNTSIGIRSVIQPIDERISQRAFFRQYRDRLHGASGHCQPNYSNTN